MRWLIGLIDRLFVVAGALIFLQAPLFMQQYTQQLAGHTAELQYQVQILDAAAGESGKTVPAYILKFTASADLDFARQGRMMQDLVDRWHTFNKSYEALTKASITSKPFVFVAYFNKEVAAATWSSFEYGIPFSLEGLVYAVAGILLGYLTFALLAFLLRSIGRLFTRRKVIPTP